MSAYFASRQWIRAARGWLGDDALWARSQRLMAPLGLKADLRAMLDIRNLLREDMVLGAQAAIRRFGDLNASVESHRRLVEAIEAGDADAARGVAAEIVQRNQKFVLGLYALAGPDETETT